jgi:threonine dehydrogenase-like Zn-dependent dehydrogenase
MATISGLSASGSPAGAVAPCPQKARSGIIPLPREPPKPLPAIPDRPTVCALPAHVGAAVEQDGQQRTRGGTAIPGILIGRGYMQYAGLPGHEFVGIVEKSANTALVGKRIVGEINCACGSCAFCRLGHPRHCSERTVLGILGRDGCFAEYIVLPDKNLHVLPQTIADFEGVMVEPTAAAFRVVEQLGEMPGIKVAVTGDGKLGLLVAQALACEGASVCLIGNHPERRRLLAGPGIEFYPSAAIKSTAMQGAVPKGH